MIETKKLTHLALLTAIALVLFVVEAQLPPLIPVPGVKLGLSNIITLVTLMLYGARDTFLVLLTRILLGSFFCAQLITLFFSLAGGLLCFALCICLYHRFSLKSLWLLSILGACTHNIGQILVAILITGTTDILWYLPILLLSGILTGAFTGLVARYFLEHLTTIQTTKQHKKSNLR